MPRDGAGNRAGDSVALLGLIARDTGRLLDQHVALARSEIAQGMHEVVPALAAIGAGGGLIATGGVLASLMVVHGLHRSTRLPLWGCYGVVGGLMASLGAGLMKSGARRAAHIHLVPRETIAALREDAQWIKDQVSRSPGP